MNKILEQDLDYIFNKLSSEERKKLNGKILLTGCAGFLGYYFIHFLLKYADTLNIQKIIGLDNFLVGKNEWIEKLNDQFKILDLKKFDIISDDISKIDDAEDVNFVIHMASIASPSFYRKYPVETIDSNINGLRRLFDFYLHKNLDGFLFFSSSEIYGDPPPDKIPTVEDYRGNVNTMGPRACYDESKRFGETMCYIFNERHNFPVTIARPFNNYGPGMSIHDKRLPADFAKAILENENLTILSDGTPKRTFCYISDAITGYIKVLLYHKLEAFNIGIDKPEISVKELSEIYLNHARKIFGYTGEINFAMSPDKNYLTDNPNRRCPVIKKAKDLLGYDPQIFVDEGVGRYLQFLK